MSKTRLDPRAILIAETGPSWRLYHRPWADKNGWHQLYLVRTGKYPKRAFWLSWKNRLAKGGDAWILQQYEPEAHSWVDVECHGYDWAASLANVD